MAGPWILQSLDTKFLIPIFRFIIKLKEVGTPMLVEIEEVERERIRQHSANAKWLMQRYDKYRRKFGEEYVAVDRGRILDHDRDVTKLKERITKRYGDRPFFIQYIYREKPQLVL